MATHVAQEAEARHAHVVQEVYTETQGQVDQANSRASATELAAKAKMTHMHGIMQEQLVRHRHEQQAAKHELEAMAKSKADLEIRSDSISAAGIYVGFA